MADGSVGRRGSGVRLRPAPKGRRVDPAALGEVRSLLGRSPRRADLLIEYLHRIQDRYGHLSAAHLTALADELRLATAEVYEVASFYHHFDIVKEGDAAPPAVTVRVCESVACHLAGGDALLERLRAVLADGVRVVPAPCVGRCAGAPVAVVGRNPVDGATVDTVRAAVGAGRVDPVLPSYVDYAAYRAGGGYDVLRACVDGRRTVDDVLGAVESAGLRGLGGAGFPTHRKWRFVRSAAAPRFVAINADEGEPGTFKDRYCMETDPHRVLEGTLLAAWAVGADEVFFYLRDEYAACRAILEREVAALYADPPCALPAFQLRRGAGAYICGEETSLIESLEGRRGEPRLRPPFPAQFGVFGRPTLVQNVETVFWLRDIVEAGGAAAWQRAAARLGGGGGAAGEDGRAAGGAADAAAAARHPGLRFFSVSGRVRRPGVYLAPNGVTARRLIDEYAGGMQDGHTFYGYLPGGASGGILPASLADVPLDFGVLAEYGCFIGSAAIVVFSDRDRARDVAANLMHFFAHESCGKCTPCRAGTAKAAELMRAERWDLPVLDELSKAMMDASICGLGQAAVNPVASVVRYFGEEVGAREAAAAGA
jgi:NADH:ubiquinone oxidoreductase subunit F (NADH-binding)/NADH:ubiquinone oxidoreductase subunit E